MARGTNYRVQQLRAARNVKRGVKLAVRGTGTMALGGGTMAVTGWTGIGALGGAAMTVVGGVQALGGYVKARVGINQGLAAREALSDQVKIRLRAVRNEAAAAAQKAARAGMAARSVKLNGVKANMGTPGSEFARVMERVKTRTIGSTNPAQRAGVKAMRSASSGPVEVKSYTRKLASGRTIKVKAFNRGK